MMAVVVSGIFGRYVYVRIPKAANGQFLSEAALKARQSHLLQSILERYQVDEPWIAATVAQPAMAASHARFSGLSPRLMGHLGRRRRHFRDLGINQGMPLEHATHFAQHLLDYENLLSQSRQSGLLQRLFGYWHVFHLPLAVIMMVIMVFHIIVAFIFGYFWIS